MRTAEQLTTMITEAELALHDLQLGESAVEVRNSSGSSVRYTPANVGRLKQYIKELKAELDAVENGTDQTYRPIGISF